MTVSYQGNYTSFCLSTSSFFPYFLPMVEMNQILVIQLFVESHRNTHHFSGEI